MKYLHTSENFITFATTTEIKHFNINNKNEKDSAPDLWSLV